MSETQPSTTATATEPVTTAAQEANTDPIRTNATNDLSPESRPEVAEGASAPAGEAVKSEVADLDAPKGMAVVETQPINEGVLSYKQPGLVK